MFADLEALSRDAAREIVALARASVAARGRFVIALAGGNTPRRTYELLAERYRDAIDWPRAAIVFGDERAVPPNDERSNYRMVREALLSRVRVPDECVHPVPTHGASAEQAAERYEETLRHVLGDQSGEARGRDAAATSPDQPMPTVDLALLGVGPDGHTASLFPGSPALDERTRWAIAVDAPTTVQPAVPRVTTTLAFLDGARAAIFLVAGADKRRVVSEILEARESARRYPAAMVAPRGRVLWMIEQSAAPASTLNAEPS